MPMKKIQAIIATERLSAVNDALRKAEVRGITVYDGKGSGAGIREEVHGSRGTTQFTPEFQSST